MKLKKISVFVFIVLFLGNFFSSFPQEFEYQPLVSGMDAYKAGNYQKALKNFLKAEKTFPTVGDQGGWDLSK